MHMQMVSSFQYILQVLIGWLFPLIYIHFIPRKAKNGRSLPSARTVSTKLTSIRTRQNSPINTILLMALGQFIDHDLDHVPMESKFLISIMPNEALWHTCSKIANRHTPPLLKDL